MRLNEIIDVAHLVFIGLALVVVVLFGLALVVVGATCIFLMTR